MSGLYGQRDVASASDKLKYINISKNIRKFPAYRKELIKRLNSGVFGKESPSSDKWEWSTRDNRPMTGTLGAAYTSGGMLEIKETGVFNVDDIFQVVDSEGAKQARVIRVSDGGTRVYFSGIAGDTIGSLAIGTKISVVSMGTPHGKTADEMVTTGIEDYYNFLGNFEDVIDLSSTDQASNIRGREKSAALIARKQEELVEKLQRALVFGKRYQNKAEKITLMGGLYNMIETYAPQNVLDFGGSAIWGGATWEKDVQKKLDSGFDIVAKKAFKKPVMWVSPAFMEKFKFVQADRFYTKTDGGAKRGIGVVRTYDTHTFGPVDVVQLQGLDGLMDDFAFIVDESDVGYKPLVDWRTYKLAKNGQSDRWQIEGQFHFMVGIPEAHVVFTNLG